MYFIVFARYDSWDEYGGDSGRLAYLTDDLADADARWYDLNYGPISDDCGLTVRRGGVFGSFDSLDDPELLRFLRASDELSGRTPELELAAWTGCSVPCTRRRGTSDATLAA